ncbi:MULTISPECIES: FadR/GntR family transcriptional regulator [unclassified Brevibacterium]|uniref:FadR/GntR family transcriptional regulator n=1 Tax=unclassified Brevibacterium TaxID=2614124 RepID=UPI000C59CC2E|nr:MULTISPECIES: FCD domain-containing protein [unclassified Brevibacterium]SMX91444.1 DNA-binding transcriptional regulator, FadR family [Brevibacterium sp. 239c]
MAGKNSRANRKTHEVDQALFTAPGSAAVTRLSAVDTVRARVLLSIEHALLAPGSKLPRTEHIAGGLEVSHITARRALESLVDDGVLVRRRGRGGGTFVADDPPALNDSSVTAYRADEQAILRLIDQRSLMESAIVVAAAQRATATQCDELDDLILQSKNAADWHEHHIPDTRFHRLCAEISDLPEVPTYLACYEALTKYFVPYPQEQLDEGRDHHARLVAAFRAHDPMAAVDIARVHVDALRREMFVGLGH